MTETENQNLGIKAKVKPTRILYENFSEEDNSVYRVIACELVEDPTNQVKLNDFGNLVVSGDNLKDFDLDTERDVYLIPSESKRYKDGYTANVPVESIPIDSDGQWTFLKSIVSENDFLNISDVYNIDDHIIDIIRGNDSVDFAKKVKGFGESRLMILQNKIKEREEYARVYMFLKPHGFTDSMILRIHNRFRSYSYIKNVFNSNMFMFAKINGIGFRTMDKIYLQQPNASKESYIRIDSALYFYLRDNEASGNTRVDKHKLVQGTQRLLDINVKLIKDVLDLKVYDVSHKNSEQMLKDMEKLYPFIFDEDEEYQTAPKTEVTDPNGNTYKLSSDIIQFQNKYSTYETFYAETWLMVDLIKRANIEPNLIKVDMDELINNFEEKEGFTLSEQQRQFFLDIYKGGVSFLAGYAGTGKTTSQKMMLEYAKYTNQDIFFLAPTGRARKKLSEYTGHTTYTIHSFVGRGMGGGTGIYFVDESSMVDVNLAKSLLEIVPPQSKIIFAGDDEQAPSVSHGNFMYDCLNSGIIPNNRYTEVFRQSEGGILDIATKIRQGIQFLPNTFTDRKVFGKNCVFDMRKDMPIEVKAVKSYLNTLKSGDYKVEDVALLSPTKKGRFGTTNINVLLQNELNPRKESLDSEEETYFKSMTNDIEVEYRIGDLVMNQKNSNDMAIVQVMGSSYMIYDDVDDLPIEEEEKKDARLNSVVNGDIGTIVGIQDDFVIVEIEDFLTAYKKQDFHNGVVIHGWCITAHKSQGSEYKVIIMIMDRSASRFMNGNLFYTMITRAKDLLLCLGDSMTINKALKNFENLNRDTNLIQFFKIYKKGIEEDGE